MIRIGCESAGLEIGKLFKNFNNKLEVEVELWRWWIIL